MKRLALALVVCLLTLGGSAWARSQQSGLCSRGGQTVTVPGLGQSVTKFVQTYPGCTITVYLTGTSTLATLYSDNSGTPKANPFTADGTTSYWNWFADNGTYDVQASGTGVASPFVIGTYTLTDTAALTSIVLNGNTITAAAGSATITIPNVTSTLVNLSSSQNLTNKTLTAPVISGGTIDNVPIGNSTPAIGTFTTLNKVLNAATFSGADIAAKINAAFASCSTCTVMVPAGTYNSVTTTISFPVADWGTASLVLDGVTINYTGSGYALEAIGSGQTDANVSVQGGVINGTSSGLGGIHIRAFNGAKFYSVHIAGFTNGDGWFNEGVNVVDCYSCTFHNNKNGIHQVGIVVSATAYAPNAVHFWGGQSFNNSQWGIFEDGSLTATAGDSSNNSYVGMNIATNGSNASPSTTGNVFFQRCYGCSLERSYLEYGVGTTRTNQVLLGDSTSGCGGANSCFMRNGIIRGNFFNTNGTITNTINCVNCNRVLVEGNVETDTPTNFFNNGSLSTWTYLGFNDKGSATNGITGTGTYSVLINPGTFDFAAQNMGNVTNTAQAVGFSGNDTYVRSATGGSVLIQDQSGGNTTLTVQGTMSSSGLNTATGGLKIGASGSTISDSREMVQSAHSCGTTSTCANTANGANRIVFGSVALSSGTPSAVTVSGISPAFTSTSTYFCTATPEGGTAAIAAGGIALTKVSGSSFTLTGPNTVTTVIDYQCIGN